MENEIDWKEAATRLAKDVKFALNHLKMSGSGMIVNRENQTTIHWRDRMCDNLDYIGYHIDKDDAHAMDLPKREREKYFKEKYPEGGL